MRIGFHKFQTNRQTNKQTDKQTKKQTDKQTNKTNKQISDACILGITYKKLPTTTYMDT